MSLQQAMANIALGVSGAFGGGVGYVDSVAKWPGTPVTDDAGSIVTPATPIEKPCSAMVDKVTERMRLAAGYTDKDVGLFILSATLDAQMDTDGRVTVTTGPHAGIYSVDMIDRDPAGIYWECRGRKVGNAA